MEIETKCHPPYDCMTTCTAGGWTITIMNPQFGVQSTTTFEYRLDRGNSNRIPDMSNVRICLCPTLSEEELNALINFEETGCIVTFESGEQEFCTTDPEISKDNQGNPLCCGRDVFGLQFEDFPQRGNDRQDFIDIKIVFNEPVEVLVGSIGFGAGGVREIWDYLCAVPGCPVESPVVRKCIAQVCPIPRFVTCEACSCRIIDGVDCEIELKKFNCCLIRGRVTCTEVGEVVANALVLAIERIVGGVPGVFSGITNEDGYYCIVVPPGEYAIECYCARNCICTPIDCDDCGCR